MRIMIAGAWRHAIFEQACSDAVRRLGHDVVKFQWSQHFRGRAGRWQDAVPVPGPALVRLNAALARSAEHERPEVVIVWRGTHILPRTSSTIRKVTQALLVSYNNDDPFGPTAHGRVPWHHHFEWFWYRRTLKVFDLTLVFRPVNIEEARACGAKEVGVLMPYYVPGVNSPVQLTDTERRRYECDLVFVGHYEPDERAQHLRALVTAGLHVRLFGGRYWTRDVLGSLADYFGEVSQAKGRDYAKCLCGARMCLAFLSKLNRDVYTYRCLEIPACGRLLLSERTPDLLRRFKDGEEAVFFSGRDEMVERATWLRDHPGERRRIAEAGRRRLQADQHSVIDRMETIVSMIDELPGRHAVYSQAGRSQ